jgi:hypothetical protein
LISSLTNDWQFMGLESPCCVPCSASYILIAQG